MTTGLVAAGERVSFISSLKYWASVRIPLPVQAATCAWQPVAVVLGEAFAVTLGEAFAVTLGEAVRRKLEMSAFCADEESCPAVLPQSVAVNAAAMSANPLVIFMSLPSRQSSRDKSGPSGISPPPEAVRGISHHALA